MHNYGTATLNGGTYTRSLENGSKDTSGGNSWYNIVNDDNASLTFNEGVTVLQGGGFSSMIRNLGYILINGGYYSGGLNTVKNDANSSMTIKDGTFINTTQATILNWNDLVIDGGTYESEAVVVFAGFYDDYTSANTVINGGYFSGTIVFDLYNGYEEGTIWEINGGTYTATSQLFATETADGDLYEYFVINAGTFIAPTVEITDYLSANLTVVESDGVYTVAVATPEAGVTTEDDLADVTETTVFVKDAEAIDQVIFDTINSSDELSELILNSEEEVTIELIADVVDESTIDVDVIAEIAELAADKTVATYLDINIVLNYEDSESVNITELNDEIEISIKLSDDLINTDEGVTRVYYIIRVHDEVTELLEATLDEDGYLTFSSNLFSTYALVYEDIADEVDTDVDADVDTDEEIENPTTGDTIFGLIAMGSISAAGMFVIYKKRLRKN